YAEAAKVERGERGPGRRRGEQVKRPGKWALGEAFTDERRILEGEAERQERADENGCSGEQRSRAEVRNEGGRGRLVGEVGGGEEGEERQREEADDEREGVKPGREKAACHRPIDGADPSFGDGADDHAEKDGSDQAGEREDEAPAPLGAVLAGIV